MLLYIQLSVTGRHLWFTTALTWESVHTSPTVFLLLENGGFRWKFADISIETWDSSYIRSVAAILNFCGRGLTLRQLSH